MSLRRSLFSLSLAAACAATAGPAAAWWTTAPVPISAGPDWHDALAIGDIDGDARADLVVTRTQFAGTTDVLLYRQASDGTLRSPLRATIASDARSGVALIDLNGDRRKEVVVGQGDGITIIDAVALSRKSPSAVRRHFAIAPAVQAIQVVGADIDRDGKADIVAQGWSTGATVFFGDGRGGIARRAWLETQVDGQNDLEAGDINGDGNTDIVAISGEGVVDGYLHYNDGQDAMASPISFSPHAGTPGGALGAIGIGDFNSDGRTDLASAHGDRAVKVYRQQSDGSLGSSTIHATEALPTAIVGADLDLDGDDDLVVATFGPQVDNRWYGSIDVYEQDMGALMVFPWTIELPNTTWNPQGLDVGDLDGDDCPDIVVALQNRGLWMLKGGGCWPLPPPADQIDLGVSLGATPTSVAVRIDASEADVPAPRVDIVLSTEAATLALGAMPEGCTVSTKTSKRASVRCTAATLAGGTAHTWVLPIQATAQHATRARLTATATAHTSGDDADLANNLAQHSIGVPVAALRAVKQIRK